MAKVLDKLPKNSTPKRKSACMPSGGAAARKDADARFDQFVALYQEAHDKTTNRLKKDRPVLLAFYDFTAELWIHLRTTNPIESSFAMIRHRARQAKGRGSRAATLAMMFKLGCECEKNWRRLNGHEQFHELIEGVRFIDHVAKNAA